MWLIGMMGSGKTSAGRLAARWVGASFADTDELIVSREGRAIGEIWRVLGEPAFRAMERDVVKELSAGDGICATGGGVVLSAENRAVMKETGRIVWMEASPQTLARRLGDSLDRPALLTAEKTDEDVLKEMLEARRAFYEESADIWLPTDGLDVEETAREIEALWRG